MITDKLAALFSRLPQVESVSLGGSHTTGRPDSSSDIDLYVFTQAIIPLESRQSIVEQAGGASKSNLGLSYWGDGDEWLDAATGAEIDIVYFGVDWMQKQITRVLDEHKASLGYTTCFWRTVRQSRMLFDRHSWFASLQDKCQAAYPEKLRQNIIEFNHAVLRKAIPSYSAQWKKAVQRQDFVSINHRTAALLASYFDVLFAFNRLLHPGEKRLISFALDNCKRLPDNFKADMESVMRASPADGERLLADIDELLNQLDFLLTSDPSLRFIKP